MNKLSFDYRKLDMSGDWENAKLDYLAALDAERKVLAVLLVK